MEKAHSNIEVIDKATLQATDKLEAITTRINNENMVARTSLFNIAVILNIEFSKSEMFSPFIGWKRT